MYAGGGDWATLWVMKLDSLLASEFRLMEVQKKALKKLGVNTVEDLLYYFPVRYGNTSEIKSISSLVSGSDAVVYGRISELKTSKGFVKKIAMSEGVIEDDHGRIKIVWFNQPYIAKMIADGQLVRVEGRVSQRKTGGLYMSNPKIEVVREIPNAVGESLFGPGQDEHILYPVYAESKGVSSHWIYHTIQKIFKSGILDTLHDPLPEEILHKYNLPTITTALVWIHAPKNQSDALSARKRFAFEEIFFIQLEKQRERKLSQKEKAFTVEKSSQDITDFVSRFPFKPTDSQTRAIETILVDFRKTYPMARLLEGDVGSGKTAVAATIAFAVATSRPHGQNFGNLQVAYMAPTEILVKQHFENFIQYFRHLPIKIGLITGSGCQIFPSKVDPSGSTAISRTQLLKWVANGEIPILIGTHALIYKSVVFKHLALVVIDEQHRFGTMQRQKLTTKDTQKSSDKSRNQNNTNNMMPHLLSMTATPIPRTLALTIYGDLDLTLLDQMPVGRKPIITKIILQTEREKTYEHIRSELKNGRQLYVICPRINEPDPDKEGAVMAKSVTEEAKRLKNDIFQNWNIDILHSKMTPAEKEKTMSRFLSHSIDILVATSVVEVGVNVPNSTMIIIEGAERFGLSQLHQLRGRVIRSNHQAYCFVFAESKSEKTRDRLKALITAKNGFELSEFDLAQRGAGELYGRKQWGISDLAMEGIQNIKMVEAARTEAFALVEDDPNFKKYPFIKKYFDSRTEKIHFE